MDWTNSNILTLIDAYRGYPVLWDLNDRFYKIPNKKNDAWNEIAGMFNCDGAEIKRKINSLLASYRRERQRMLTKKSKDDAGLNYKSKWFAFNSFCFLSDRYKPKKPRDMLNYENDGIEDEKLVDHHEFMTAGYAECVLKPEKEEEFHGSPTETKEQNPNNMFCFPPQRPVKREITDEDSRMNDDYNILKSIATTERDECTTYGEHVGNKLRKIDERSLAIAQHKINNILFEAEMGMYSNNFHQDWIGVSNMACKPYPRHESQSPQPSLTSKSVSPHNQNQQEQYQSTSS